VKPSLLGWNKWAERWKAENEYEEGEAMSDQTQFSNADCTEHHARSLNRCVVSAVASCSSKDFK
jgi:hypothetical protein